jgi:hypothetical protein
MSQYDSTLPIRAIPSDGRCRIQAAPLALSQSERCEADAAVILVNAQAEQLRLEGHRRRLKWICRLEREDEFENDSGPIQIVGTLARDAMMLSKAAVAMNDLF